MNIKMATAQNTLEPGMSSRLKLLKIIESFPGIRYNDIIRLTGSNNGSLSHHLAILEKNSLIKILRSDNSNITRFFSISVSSEESIIVGYLKIKSTSQIIKLLHDRKQSTFTEIVQHINKSPSTASWNIKRLIDAKILIKTKTEDFAIYSLRKPDLIENLLVKSQNTILDRTIDNFGGLIEDL